MTITLFQVDSFAREPFKGNPAGVCVLDHPADEKWMQNLAMEMNLSETAFLWPERDEYRLRWFTPSFEIALCGHGTLAAAHILWEQKYLKEHEVAKFITKSGILSAQKRGTKIFMDFPSQPPKPCPVPPSLQDLSIGNILYCGTNYQDDLLVEIESEALVRDFQPKFDTLQSLARRGFIISAKSSHEGYDFVSRFFACDAGFDEDPVTGSAHCCLAPYWAEKLGKNNLVGLQTSKRSGFVGCELKSDRVILNGTALTIFRIELLI
jgi:predicted PhzF superfamily epimerase YddE/YHI9